METLANENSPESERVAADKEDSGDSSMVKMAGDIAEPATGTPDLAHEPEVLASVDKPREEKLAFLSSPLPPGGGSSTASSLSVGDFVWVKVRGRPWWPGLVCNPSSPAVNGGKIRQKERATFLVAYLGEGTTAWCEPSQLKDFFVEFQKMSNQSSSKGFLKAVEGAVDEIGKHLQWELTCNCVPPELRAKKRRGYQNGRLPLVNLQPPNLVERLRLVACDVLEAAHVLEIAMLKSWAMAFGKGWDDGSPGYHLQCGLEELVDKIDFDIPAGELGNNKEEEKDEWVTGSEVTNVISISAAKLDKSKKKSMTALIAEMDMGTVELSNGGDVKADENTESLNHKEESEDEKCLLVDNDSAKAEEETSSHKRERKKSKYLSPPYTDSDAGIKYAVSPIATEGDIKIQKKSSLTPLYMSSESTANLGIESNKKEEDKGSLTFNFDPISVHEIATELRYTASDPLHLKWNRLAKTVKGFFAFYRISTYSSGSNFVNYQKYLNASSGKNLKSFSPMMTSTCPAGISERNMTDRNDGVETASMTDSISFLKSCPEQSKPCKRKMNVKNDVYCEAPRNVDAQIVNLQIESRYEQKNIKIGGNGESVAICSNTINYLQPFEKKQNTKEKIAKSEDKAWSNGESPDLFGNTIFKFSHEGKAERMRKKAESPNSRVPRYSDCSIANGLEKSRSSQNQHMNGSNYINPVTLLLSFKGTSLPSRDDLISTFSKYGTLLEQETGVLEESACAHVVFAKRTDAETALKSSDKSGVFRPPNTTYHLHHVSQAASSQEPAIQNSNPMLPFIKENLESMISSLTSSSPSKEAGLLDGLKPDARENLVGDMEGLLKKVNLMLNGPAAGTSS